jgi:hypothetical protein
MLAFSEILKSQMSKKNKQHRSISSQLIEKLMDIVLIIVSVYIALTVEGWAEKRHEHKRLLQYYQGFNNEIKTDTAELRIEIKDARFHIDNCKRLIKLLKSKDVSEDTIRKLFSKVSNSNLFGNSGMISYKSMVTSGDMRLMEDLEMRRSMVLLDETYFSIKLIEELYLKFITGDLVNYANTNFDLTNGEPINKDYYKLVEFKNLIINFMGVNESRLRTYEQSIMAAKKALKLINKQIEH